MRSLKQLLRQPVKTLFGVILIAIAVAVLCICLGQSYAAKETEERLNETYMTAAFTEGSMSRYWINIYAGEHPEVVKSVSQPGLASAYIPELTIDNWTQHWHSTLVQQSNMFAPYDTAILEIELLSVGEAQRLETYAKDEHGIYVTGEYGELIPLEYPGEAVVVNVTGTVLRPVALEEGYPDPTGFTVRFTLSLPSQETLDELNLTVGERYLIYSSNYVDQDWILRHQAASIMTWYEDTKLPEWDLDTFRWLDGSRTEYNWTEEQKATLIYDELDEGWIYTTDPLLFEPGNKTNLELGLEDTPIYATSFYVDGFKCKIGDFYHGMDLAQYNMFRSVSMICNDDGTMPNVRVYQDEDGTWVCELIEERSYLDAWGHEILITQEEYAKRYREPIIAHLTGTAEEFLAGDANGLWAEALHNVEVNNHAFAIIGVDKLRYIENFNSGEAKIVQGRDFTAEELETGAKVCIISKQLAEANGLTVGDTIDPQFYDPDMSLDYQLSMSENAFCPKPFYYFSGTTQLQPAQSYTIVGIYEQNDPTPTLIDQTGNTVNPYGFTSNTIFAPKASIDAVMQYGDSWLFKTVLLHNGMLEEFQLAAIEAGLGEELRYTDSGYAAVEDSLGSYRENVNRALTIGIMVYTIVMMLYLVLFPAQQRSVLATMESLGAERGKRIYHVLSGSFWFVLSGTVLGTGIGLLLWQKVVDMLTEGSRMVLNIQMRGSTIICIGGAQMLLAMAVIALLAIPMTRGRSLMKRK